MICHKRFDIEFPAADKLLGKTLFGLVSASSISVSVRVNPRKTLTFSGEKPIKMRVCAKKSAGNR